MVVMTFLFSILYVILYRLFSIVLDYRMHWGSVHHSPCVIRWSYGQGSSPVLFIFDIVFLIISFVF